MIQRSVLFIGLALLCLCAIPKDAWAMEIFAHAPSRTVTLDVEPSDTIENVKTKIQDVTGVVPTYQTLTLEGVPLDDGQTVSDYALSAGDSIDLALSAPEFIITVKTDNTGVTDDHSFQIPIDDGMVYNYDIDWGDGATTTGTTTSAVHTYAVAGLHQIKITGTFPLIKFNFGGDKDKLISVDQWGTNAWRGMNYAGCSHLTFTAYDAPNLSAMSDLVYSFRATGLTNENLNGWDVSTITYFLGTFQDTPFNGDVSGWNTSGVVNMAAMFYDDTAFNQDISGWNVSAVTNMNSMFAYDAAFNNGGAPLNWGSKTSNVTDMALMFYHVTSFNQEVGNWDVSKVTNMNSMFEGATSFNNSDSTNVHRHPILWGSKTSHVTNMQGMFTGDSSFNQDVSSWDTSSVTTMAYMFSGATLFKQALGEWNVGNVTTMDNALTGTALSIRQYDTTLRGWAAQTLQTSVGLGAGSSRYCDTASHAILTDSPNNWSITDGGSACVAAPSVSFTGSTPENGTRSASTSIEAELSLSAEGDSYSFVDFDHSLKGWWRFEQTGHDDSGNNDASTWAGTEAYATGRFGTAGNFDGASSLDVTVPEPIDSSFTVSAWVYLNSITEGAAIIGDEHGHLLQIGGSNRWQFDNTYSPDSVASERTWTHVVGVYDASTEMETLYVNGESVSSGGGTRVVAQTLNIGKRSDDQYINGRIDDVMVMSRALSAEEVAALYDSGENGYDHIFSSLSAQDHYIQGYLVNDYGTTDSTETRTISLGAAPPVDDTHTNPTAVRSRHGASILYGCKDPLATNYTYFAASNPSLCQYGLSKDTQAISTSTRTLLWSRNLSYGMSGTDVRDLQKYLIAANIGPAAHALGAYGVTGYFGNLTRSAVAELQKANGIRPMAGYFGPLTRAVIKERS